MLESSSDTKTKERGNVKCTMEQKKRTGTNIHGDVRIFILYSDQATI